MSVIAVIAPGAMGAAVGACLVEHGAEVWTVLAGRSASQGDGQARQQVAIGFQGSLVHDKLHVEGAEHDGQFKQHGQQEALRQRLEHVRRGADQVEGVHGRPARGGA